MGLGLLLLLLLLWGSGLVVCFVGGVLRPPSSYGFFTMTQEYSVADLAGFRQTVGYAVYAFVIVAIYFLLSLFRYTLCLCVCVWLCAR